MRMLLTRLSGSHNQCVADEDEGVFVIVGIKMRQVVLNFTSSVPMSEPEQAC